MNDTDFENGFMCAMADLVRAYDMPSVAAGTIMSNGLDEIDCKDVDEFDKIQLRKLNDEEGLSLKSL